MEETIAKAAVFRSHYEAAKCISDRDTRLTFLEALLDYQFYGEQQEDLPEIAKALMTGFIPVIDKELEGKRGGKPQKELPPLEKIESMRSELGSMDAVAAALDVDKATIYRHMNKERQALQCCKTAAKCNVASVASVANVAKTNEERRKKNEEGVKEEREKGEQEEKQGVGQCPPMELQAAPAPLETSASQNSAPFPTGQVLQDAQGEADGERQAKRAKPFVPPTVGEVAEYCEKRENGVDAEAFVAFYASKGWFVGKNKMKDWRQAVITWEKRDRGQPPYQARGSPAGAAASCDREWNSSRQVF